MSSEKLHTHMQLCKTYYGAPVCMLGSGVDVSVRPSMCSSAWWIDGAAATNSARWKWSRNIRKQQDITLLGHLFLIDRLQGVQLYHHHSRGA